MNHTEQANNLEITNRNPSNYTETVMWNVIYSVLLLIVSMPYQKTILPRPNLYFSFFVCVSLLTLQPPLGGYFIKE